MNNIPLYVIAGGIVVGGAYFALQSMKLTPASESKSPSVITETKQTNNNQEKNMNNQTIVDVAVSNGNFKTLVAAIQAAGLVDTLSGPGPFTVFAPTDAAFAKLPAGTVEKLLEDKAKLTEILTYHVVSGKVMAADVVKLDSAKTVQGEDVLIKADSNGVMINSSRITQPDIITSNGVIHVIDTVLMPK